MPSDPPLHVALGPDLRRPSVRQLFLAPLGHQRLTKKCSVSGHYTSGGKERWHKRQDTARLSQFRAESESRLPTNLQWSLQSKDARKTPETSFVLPTKFPLAPTFAPKMPTRSVSTPNVYTNPYGRT